MHVVFWLRNGIEYVCESAPPLLRGGRLSMVVLEFLSLADTMIVVYGIPLESCRSGCGEIERFECVLLWLRKGEVCICSDSGRSW